MMPGKVQVLSPRGLVFVRCGVLSCARLRRKSGLPCDGRCAPEREVFLSWLMLSDSCFFLGARMRAVIDLGEVLEIEMGVDLRGRDAGMPQHLLHRAQVARGLQH